MTDKCETSVKLCGPRRPEWETSVEAKGEWWETSVNLCGPRSVGNKRETSVNSCATHPEWERSVGEKCGRHVWERSVGDRCKLMRPKEPGAGDNKLMRPKA